ncbi:MAG: hypothetical protein ABSE58_04660 [Candidatus Limnocylindrales bacterium]|jgi:hypothetical protein
MLGGRTRDARRTERYLDGLLSADERRASEIPVDVEMDPAVQFAARELRAGLTRVHPSFRFEEALAARLATGAARLRAGLPVEEVAGGVRGSLAQFRGRPLVAGVAGPPDLVPPDLASPDLAPPDLVPPALGEPTHAPAGRIPTFSPAAAFHRLPEMAARPSRPLIVGGVGVGVASAAISIGAVYVAWRHSHTPSAQMGRAVRAAHGRAPHPGRSRRTGVINGILGVMS